MLKVKRIIAGCIATISLLVMNPVQANAEWKQDSAGWCYTEGNLRATGWKQIDTNWYYFDLNGYMAYDTIIDGYYVNNYGAWSNNIPSSAVYNKIMRMNNKYPEGMTWTNDNSYHWKGAENFDGYGCAAFAFILSDAAFGNIPGRYHNNCDNIRVGDIIRLDDNHSVVALEIKDNSVVVAEGNYNSSIHWGREISLDTIKESCTHIITRYPQ